MVFEGLKLLLFNYLYIYYDIFKNINRIQSLILFQIFKNIYIFLRWIVFMFKSIVRLEYYFF